MLFPGYDQHRHDQLLPRFQHPRSQGMRSCRFETQTTLRGITHGIRRQPSAVRNSPHRHPAPELRTDRIPGQTPYGAGIDPGKMPALGGQGPQWGEFAGGDAGAERFNCALAQAGTEPVAQSAGPGGARKGGKGHQLVAVVVFRRHGGLWGRGCGFGRISGEICRRIEGARGEVVLGGLSGAFGFAAQCSIAHFILHPTNREIK